MPAVRSAGLLLYRGSLQDSVGIEVLLGHMGGPFWERKDARAWSIFKGEIEPDEGDEAAARREFHEETGSAAPAGELIELGEVRQRSRKVVVAWGLCGDFNPADLNSNRFEMEWPPRSGRLQRFPEIDRAGWFTIDEAREKLVAAQVAFLDRLLEQLADR